MLPISLTWTIWWTSFYWNSFQWVLVIPKWITIIDRDAFHSNKFTRIDFSNATQLKEIWQWAFCDMYTLEWELRLPENLEKIWYAAFRKSFKTINQSADNTLVLWNKLKKQ